MSASSLTLLVSIDGLRPEALQAGVSPSISALWERGTGTLQAQTVMPSITLPCHLTMFRSLEPARHGTTTNEFVRVPDTTPGLVELAHAAGLRTAFFYNWGPLRDLADPLALDFSFCQNDCESNPASDEQIADAAITYLGGGGYALAFVYFGTLDPAGHRHGFMSGEYLDQLGHIDRAFGSLIGSLPKSTTILLTSDHGGHGTRHGSELPEDMTIPWVLAGPGIREGHSLVCPVSLLDTAPTLARILNITPHQKWQGRCIEEAFVEGR